MVGSALPIFRLSRIHNGLMHFLESQSFRRPQRQDRAGCREDIRDLVIRIFEACNFQDLIGQRITKVMPALKPIEDQFVREIVESQSVPVRPPQKQARNICTDRASTSTAAMSPRPKSNAMFEDT